MRKSRKRQKFKACMMEWPYLIKLIKEKPYYNHDLSIANGEISKAFYDFQVATCYTDCAPFPIKAFQRADGLMKIGDGRLKLWFTHIEKL